MATVSIDRSRAADASSQVQVDSVWVHRHWPTPRTSGFATTDVGIKSEMYRNMVATPHAIANKNRNALASSVSEKIQVNKTCTSVTIDVSASSGDSGSNKFLVNDLLLCAKAREQRRQD